MVIVITKDNKRFDFGSTKIELSGILNSQYTNRFGEQVIQLDEPIDTIAIKGVKNDNTD